MIDGVKQGIHLPGHTIHTLINNDILGEDVRIPSEEAKVGQALRGPHMLEVLLDTDMYGNNGRCLQMAAMDQSLNLNGRFHIGLVISQGHHNVLDGWKVFLQDPVEFFRTRSGLMGLNIVVTIDFGILIEQVSSFPVHGLIGHNGPILPANKLSQIDTFSENLHPRRFKTCNKQGETRAGHCSFSIHRHHIMDGIGLKELTGRKIGKAEYLELMVGAMLLVQGFQSLFNALIPGIDIEVDIIIPCLHAACLIKETVDGLHIIIVLIGKSKNMELAF